MPPKKRRLAVKEEQGELSTSATVTVCNCMVLVTHGMRMHGCIYWSVYVLPLHTYAVFLILYRYQSSDLA